MTTMLTPRLACYTLLHKDQLTFAYEILGAFLAGKWTLAFLALGVAALMEQEIALEGKRLAARLTGEGTIAGVTA